MEKVLPKFEEVEILRKRLQILLIKDRGGMTVIDYGFLCHRYVVGEYIRGIVSVIGSLDGLLSHLPLDDEESNYSAAKRGLFDLDPAHGALSFPKLVKVHITSVKKPLKRIVDDQEYLQRSSLLISNFGGDQIECKEIDYEPFRKLLRLDPAKLTPFQNLFKD